MRLEQISELYAYGIWANNKILETIDKISEDNLGYNFRSSYSSIKDTLVHILGAEELWLSRWSGGQVSSLLEPSQFTTAKAIIERWGIHNENLLNFVNLIQEEDLIRYISYTNLKGIEYSLELWKQMLHVTNHTSYHRGQIVTMLRQVNVEPPSTDLIYYYLGVC